MAQIKVLVEGKHQKNGEKLEIGSTVTLIKTDKNIIVDPGYYPDKEKLLESLKNEGLSPEDIDTVVLTHLHLDHIINVYLFPKAKIYCKLKSKDYSGQYQNIAEGYIVRADILDSLKLAKDVEFLLTPGHADGHISLLVDTSEGKVVIAGDAIAKESLADISKKPELFNNLEEYDNSRRKILDTADFIIPGHGPMFKVKR